MLYENTDPFILYEPGGYLDVTQAHYESVDEYSVRVTGSRWIPIEPYTLKLEGARLAGYQVTLLAMLRDAHYVKHARAWVERLNSFLAKEIENSLAITPDQYDIDIRLIGVDATLGALETAEPNSHEIGVLVIVTAASESLAEELGKLINPYLLHYPLSDDEALPTFAFPYSPAQSMRGEIYEFCLNHTIRFDEPLSAVRLKSITL